MANHAAAISERRRVFRFLLDELKPRGGPWLTPFNIISIPVMLAGLLILVYRFRYGLASVTNLSQDHPWGLWMGFDVITGVALAGGAYVITFVVYVMRVEKYQSIVRATVLNGLLAYIFYGGALLFDLGRPWHAMNPYIGNNFGFASVLFLICWHFAVYMVAAFVEFSPVIAEWLNLEKARRFLKRLTLGTVILGVTLSLLHQSGLGALFLMAKPKVHPLWWSQFIPVLFFVSSIYAGLSMIIFESTVSHRVFKKLIDPGTHHGFEEIVFGLAKGAAVTMFVYYVFKALLFIHDKQWDLINTSWGYWYLVEVLGFVLVPAFMFAFGYRNRSLAIIKTAAVLAILGVILNRLNVSIIAFRWDEAVRYYPTWQEITVTLMVVFGEIWIFRWIVNRMPVFGGAH
ncbi:MAG: polysulfide reductase NrfD [Lysobacterales bacterium]|jgi:Ni/Fe-hydrogenase subunit HybB-like protein